MAMDWNPGAMMAAAMRGPWELAGLWINWWEASAKLYWRLWGPLGQPVVMMVESVAETQRQFLSQFADLSESMTAARDD